MSKTLFILLLFWGADLFILAQGSEALDYHRQESPAISWNGSYLYNAKLLSLGGISFFPSAPFQATLNPAFIPEGGKWHLGLTYNTGHHQAFQYWGINQGVLRYEEKRQGSASQISGAAGLLKHGKFSISSGWYLSNHLQYPDFSYSGEYGGFSGDFSGRENTFFTALAWRLSGRVSVGIKLSHVAGKRQVLTTINDKYWDIDKPVGIRRQYDLYIEQDETHQRSHWALTGGTSITLSHAWTIALSAHLPFKGTVTREVDRRFRNPQADIHISSPQQGKDNLYTPKNIMIGSLFTIPLSASKNSKNTFRLAIEAKHTFWQEYQFIFFDEEIPRDLRSTSELALGLEFSTQSSRRELCFRMAFRLDPQPVKEPATSLSILCGGIGLKINKIRADLGLAYITANSGDLKLNHLMLNASLGVSL